MWLCRGGMCDYRSSFCAHTMIHWDCACLLAAIGTSVYPWASRCCRCRQFARPQSQACAWSCFCARHTGITTTDPETSNQQAASSYNTTESQRTVTNRDRRHSIWPHYRSGYYDMYVHSTRGSDVAPKYLTMFSSPRQPKDPLLHENSPSAKSNSTGST